MTFERGMNFVILVIIISGASMACVLAAQSKPRPVHIRARSAPAQDSKPIQPRARGRVTDTDACAAQVTLFAHAAQEAAEAAQLAAEAAAEALAAAQEARQGPRHPQLLARARKLTQRASGAAERAMGTAKVAAEHARKIAPDHGEHVCPLVRSYRKGVKP